MKNLAGNKDCDIWTEQELNDAGIPFLKFDFLRNQGEVPSVVIGMLDGWEFRRAWYYWIAVAKDTNLQFKYADELQSYFGNEVRVAGYAGGINPHEWYKEKWNTGVTSYHIDTQEGLNALAQIIKVQTQDICNA